MVPRAVVLTNKNCGAAPGSLGLIVGLSMCLSACAPPGQRALLQGKKLVDQGHFSEAVPKLEKAMRIFPKYAPGWNYLGLAYQGNRQAEQALKAYRTALEQDHQLAAARYNIGCLFLEQGNLAAAIEELRSYTLLQPSISQGWVKLGTAQFRARRLEEAEKAFRAALELQPRDPETLNAMGLIQYQRRRWQDALNYFNMALAQERIYPPALLNSAVLNQQLGARPQALGRYRQYVALQPRPANAEAIEGLIQQLEAASLSLAKSDTSVTTKAVAPRIPATNLLPGLTPVVRSGRPSSATVRTNAVAVSAPRTKASIPLASLTNESAIAQPATQAISPVTTTAYKPTNVEVTRLKEEPAVEPAQDLTVRSSPTVSNSAFLEAPKPEAESPGSPRGTNAPKKGFLARLNPFAGKSRDASQSNAPARAREPAPVSATAPDVPTPGTPAPTRPPAAAARYARLSPAKPLPGNRAEADPAFRRGVKAQQRGDRVQAIAEYQAALQADPAFFNAYYNLGLAALDVGDWRLSLAAYETALALNPESTDARYNFALGLKNAGYYGDATEELTRIVADSPDDVRAHLALANLYAQQLNRPKLAREHYLRVLELNPRHPEAGKIRFWLAANP